MWGQASRNKKKKVYTIWDVYGILKKWRYITKLAKHTSSQST